MDPRPKPGVLVAAAVLALATSARAAPDADAPPSLSMRGQLLFGERANRLDDVDAVLARNGYTSTPKAQRLLGFELGATVRRLRMEISVVGTMDDRVGSRTGPRELRVHRGWLSPEVGYDVYRFGTFAVFPMLGYASGDLLVDMDCSQPPLFASYFKSAPECSRNVRRSFDALKIVIGVEDVVPLWRRWIEDGGFVFGVRLGYLFQLGQGSWRTGTTAETTLAGGPDADVSGVFMLMNVGISVYKP